MAKLKDLTLKYIKFRCDVDEDTGCWRWRTDSKGHRAEHPQVHVQGAQRPVLVRRLAYELAYGGTGLMDVLRKQIKAVQAKKNYAKKRAADGKPYKPTKRKHTHMVMVQRYVVPNPSAKCSEKGCCNPEHMMAVTQRQKDRYSLAKANENKMKKCIANAVARRKYAKLTEELVAEIRLLPMSGPDRVPDTALAEKHGVCRKTIGQARRGVTWKQYGSAFGAMAQGLTR